MDRNQNREPNLSHKAKGLHPAPEDLPKIEPGQTPLNKSQDTQDFSPPQTKGEEKSLQQKTGSESQGKGTQKEGQETGSPSAAKGLGYYPISDLQFDVVCLIYEKSKALQAYDQYLRDCRSHPELQEIFEKIKADDRKHVEILKQFLGKC